MNKLVVIPIMVAILLAIDYYAFQGVKAAFGDLSAQGKRWLQIGYWALTALLIAGIFVYNFVDPSKIDKGVRTFIMVSVFFVYFGKVLMVPFLLLDDLIRLGKWAYYSIAGAPVAEAAEEAGKRISRSEFLNRLGLGIAAIPVLGMAYGIVAGAHDYRVRRVALKLPNLPKNFDGLKIVQLSDIHSGSFFNKTAVERGIDMVLGEKPDVVFFTGDLVNNVASEMDEFQDIFARIKAPMGVFSVLGNHDYGDYFPWPSIEAKTANFSKMKQVHANMGWRLLLNENVKLERGGEHISVIGIENWGKGGFSKYGKLDKAYKGTENAPVKILLSHDPSHWDAEVRQSYSDIDLMLSGHTHGMQFGIEKGDLKWSPVQYRYKQWGGLYQEGQQYLYVNRGFGYIGYPGRIGMPPEITVITLQTA